jgi:predicted protein tyrosine phosphatase
MTALALPQLSTANADFVTPQLAVGGDLDRRELAALKQLLELAEAGMTHIVDVRLEANDEDFVQRFAAATSRELRYLHHGVDDRGQAIPHEWFEVGVQFAQAAIDAGGVVLTHCHMGINRGPSLGYALLLGQGWDAVEALSAIRGARPIAYIDYADDALAWYHARVGGDSADLLRDVRRVAQWRRDNYLDASTVIRQVRAGELRRLS